MITPEQVEITKQLWEQGRRSAQYAHDAFVLAMQSQRAFISSLKDAGFPVGTALQEFDKLIAAHQTQYAAALKHMDAMAAQYGGSLEQLKKQNKK